MTVDTLETLDGGILRDAQGRRQLIAVEKHAAAATTDRPGAGTLFDADGREQVVLLGPDGRTISSRVTAVESASAKKANLPANLKEYGAIGDGATHPLSGSFSTLAAAQVVFPYATALTDEIDTAALLSALASGRQVSAPSGTFLLDKKTKVPANVTLNGEGTGVTIFLCAAAGAGIAYGDPAASTISGTGNRGGLSGNFTIYGGADRTHRVATSPLSFHDVVERNFRSIEVKYSAGDGVLVRLAQNCSFESIDIEDSAGVGLVFDEGTGGHSLRRCESTSNDGGNLKFVQSVVTAYPQYTLPSHIRFDACIFERLPEATATGTSDVILAACDHVTFNGVNFARTGSAPDGTIVLIDGGLSTQFVGLVKFTDCWFFGDDATVGKDRIVDAFQIKTFCRLSIAGGTRFQNPGIKDPGRGGAGVAGGALFALKVSVAPSIDISGFVYSTYNTDFYDLDAPGPITGESYGQRRSAVPLVLTDRNAKGFLGFPLQSIQWPGRPAAGDVRVFQRASSTQNELVAYFQTGTYRPLATEGGRLFTVASAATLTLPLSSEQLYVITGTATITAITTTDMKGKVVTLKFSAAATVQAGATIKLAGGANFVATADDTLTLTCDGTNWYEVARSVN